MKNDGQVKDLSIESQQHPPQRRPIQQPSSGSVAGSGSRVNSPKS